MRISPHQGLSFLQDGDRVWPESIWLSPLAYFCCLTSLFFAFLPPLQSLVPGYDRVKFANLGTYIHSNPYRGDSCQNQFLWVDGNPPIIATIMAITARNSVCLVSTGVVFMTCKFQCVSSLGIPQRWEVQQRYKILRKTIHHLFVKILL